MARHARVVIAGTPHHVTQRGNRRQRTFFNQADYGAYLRLAREAFTAAGVEVWGYCLMPNHVHLIATPSRPEALAQAVGTTHLRYTRRINDREGWTGYLWQGRFASFAMDEDHLLHCARYVGLNPVRAGLVERATDWPWSSVPAHLGVRRDRLLTAQPLAERIGAALDTFFDIDLDPRTLHRMRHASTTGWPQGSATWIEALEASTGRLLAPAPVGRPPKRNWGHVRLPP